MDLPEDEFIKKMADDLREMLIRGQYDELRQFYSQVDVLVAAHMDRIEVHIPLIGYMEEYEVKEE